MVEPKQMEKILDYRMKDQAICFGVLGVFIVAFRIIALLSLLLWNRNKRK